MKRFLALSVAFLLCVTMLTACGKSGLTVEKGKLHMATNAAFPPYEMTNDNGGYEGVDIEIATKIAEKLDLELVVDDMDLNSVVAAVQTGKSDIAMAGLTANEERKKKIDFTASYVTGKQVIVVVQGSPIKKADDLFADGAKYVVGTQEASTGYAYCVRDLGAERVLSYTNGATSMQALLTGKVDCVVIDNEPARQFCKANDTLQVLEKEYAVEKYAIGVSKRNNVLRDKVNEALKELIDDGTVKSILDKYNVAQ